MQQTPVHEQHNPDLLAFIPSGSRRLAEIGCSSGALARAFKHQAPDCDYVGIEIDAAYVELAKRYCDRTMVLDIELADESFWAGLADRDCWIFGDTLEHLKDPWSVLEQIRRVIPAEGRVVVCIPNAQHWSVQARLSVGDFRYESSGLLDKTHLRWFTRQTIIELFDTTGFRIEAGMPRVFQDPIRDTFLPVIESMARAAGGDPKAAIEDALPLQYVMRAVPR